MIFPAACILPHAAVFAEYSEGMEHYRKAWAAYATQDYAQAEEWGERAVRADPENAHAHALLGDLAYLRHDLLGAKRAWERALRLNPQLQSIQDQMGQADFELALEGQMREASPVARRSDLGARGQVLDLSPFSALAIRVPKDLPLEHEGVILSALAHAMEKLEPYFEYRVDRPLTILIYPREAWGLVLGLSPFSHVPTEVLGLFDGKIRIPASAGMTEERVPGLRPGTHDGTQETSVLWHEYAHAVVHDLTHGRAPRWLHEGLAQECEVIASPPSGSLGTGSGAKQSQQKGVPGLRPGTQENDPLPPLRAVLGISERPGEPVMMPAGQFYAASHLLVRYLLEARGWDRMRRLLSALGQGSSVEEALRRQYGLELLTLEKKWREWYHST